MSRDTVTIVSGLPRSGTSMMMQALQGGGMEVLTDHVRTADQDNPKGYFEYEPVKRTKEDPSWLAQAGGKVIKMVYRLVADLPADRTYHVIFMRRAMSEVLRSQRAMLERLGRRGGDVDDDQLGRLFARQIEEFIEWASRQQHIRVIEVDYGKMVADPMGQSRRVAEFLDCGLDVDAMAEAVDPKLYRNRAAKNG